MNKQKQKPGNGALIFAIITAIFHILFFVAESILWLKPYIYQSILGKPDPTMGIELIEQARLMETVFFNQGFYNLFLAVGLIAGVILSKKNHIEQGITLIVFCSLFAFGAGVVLALSTGAFLGAAIQAVPPMIVLGSIGWTAKPNKDA